MLTYKIHLFRHGITRANLEGRYVGLSDYPLCQEGIDALKEYVKDKDYPPVEKIYTSPLRRCRETAHILYPRLQDLRCAAADGDGLRHL